MEKRYTDFHLALSAGVTLRDSWSLLRKENAMTAAVMVPVPLSREGLTFWEELRAECQRYTAATNGAISSQGLAPDSLVEFDSGLELQISKAAPPSASTRLAIEFHSWGPVIRGKVTGHERNTEFCVEEWEVPIAKDLDGAVVAIFGEGRSFSPQDLARYVIQGFRCYYPAVSLPYDC